jgi:hypothetical protein
MCKCNNNCNCCNKVVITERGQRGPQGPQGPQGPAGAPGSICNTQVAIIPTENPLVFTAIVPLGAQVASYEWSSNNVELASNGESPYPFGLLRLTVTFANGCVARDYFLVVTGRS